MILSHLIAFLFGLIFTIVVGVGVVYAVLSDMFKR